MRRLWAWLRRTRLRECERRLGDIEAALRDLPAYIEKAATAHAEKAAGAVQANLDRLDVNVTRHVRALEREVAALRGVHAASARTR